MFKKCIYNQGPMEDHILVNGLRACINIRNKYIYRYRITRFVPVGSSDFIATQSFTQPIFYTRRDHQASDKTLQLYLCLHEQAYPRG